MQIVQMVPPSSLIQTSALPGSSPLLSGKTLQSKNTHPKSGIRMTGGEKSLLSPPAASAKPATAVLADGSTQLSPLKSLVISKETLGQLQPGQLLQIEIPQSKASSVGPDTSHIAGLMHNRGKPMSGLEKVDTRPTAIVQQGTVMSKPAGGVSLLRPGLITSKHSSAGLVTGSKSSSAVFVGGRLSTPGLVAKQTLSGISTPSPSAASSVQMTIVGSTPNLLTKKVNTAETPKCSLIGQSLLKSASTGCLMSLHQKQAEATQKKNEADNKGRPLYLSTKIGNQTVLLKFDNEQDAKRTLAADLGSSRDSKAADDVGAISLIHPPSSSMAVEKSILKSSANLASGQKVAALTGVSAALTPTIKHGSILGIHKQREPCKSDNFEINLTKFADFESLLMFVVPRYPLVEENVDRSVHPYSAHSETEFLGWNVGKRRAAEWQRASRVRKQILSALHGESSFHGQKVCSTKEIMTWCRQHLYSPLDNALAAKYSKNEQQKRRHKTSVSHPPGGFCSYTDHKRVLTTISDLSRSPGGSSEDEEIDIIGIEQPTKNVVKTEPLETDVDGEDVIPAEVISLCPLTQYIHQVAAQIGVNFEPVLLLLDDGSKVYMSVSEEVIVSALKCFINGLIRKAVALRHHSDRFLDEVNPRDVYDALESLPRTDFLLNTGLGTRLMSHCNTDETGSDV